FAPKRVRVLRAVAEVLGGHLGQRLPGDAMLVQVAVGFHAEELGGEVLPVLGIPARHPHQSRVLGEGTTRMFVQADGDPDVVVAQPDSVGAGLGGAGRGRAGVEHVGEGDARETDHGDDRVRIGDRPAATGGGLDVLPLDTRVVDREPDGVDAHLHRGLALETTEWVQTHSDDRDVVIAAGQAMAPDSLSSAMRSQSIPSSIRTISVCSDACGAREVTSGSWLNCTGPRTTLNGEPPLASSTSLIMSLARACSSSTRSMRLWNGAHWPFIVLRCWRQ